MKKSMSPDNIKRLRHEVENGGWIIIWAGANMPIAILNEPVELIYEDMDGVPCKCDAIYTYGENKNTFRIPFFERTDGAHMLNCIAWRYRGRDMDGESDD